MTLMTRARSLSTNTAALAPPYWNSLRQVMIRTLGWLSPPSYTLFARVTLDCQFKQSPFLPRLTGRRFNTRRNCLVLLSVVTQSPGTGSPTTGRGATWRYHPQARLTRSRSLFRVAASRRYRDRLSGALGRCAGTALIVKDRWGDVAPVQR